MLTSHKKTGMFTLEYAILITTIILALLAMQFYLRRATFGRIRGTGDVFGSGRQYDPDVTVER